MVRLNITQEEADLLSALNTCQVHGRASADACRMSELEGKQIQRHASRCRTPLGGCAESSPSSTECRGVGQTQTDSRLTDTPYVAHWTIQSLLYIPLWLSQRRHSIWLLYISVSLRFQKNKCLNLDHVEHKIQILWIHE